MVVSEISSSRVKTFHCLQRLNDHQLHPHAVRRLCVSSAESKDQQVRRPGHLVQVKNPISTALTANIVIDKIIT